MNLPAMTMEEVARDENLIRAFAEVARNRGAPGPDGQSIDDVRRHMDELLPVLSRNLVEGTYRPGMIRRVWIPKPGGGERGLGIPDVVDRWVQQAVHQVLSPHWEPTFHPSSHGFRPGRSCHTAIAEAKKHLEEGYEWVVDLDLEKFFDRVHWQRLVARLEQRIKDRRLIDLIWQMLKAKVVMPDGVVTSTGEGVPQGGPITPPTQLTNFAGARVSRGWTCGGGHRMGGSGERGPGQSVSGQMFSTTSFWRRWCAGHSRSESASSRLD